MSIQYCAECTYLDPSSSDSSGKYYCEKRGERHFSTDSKCGRETEAYSRSRSSINNMLSNSKEHQSSGCYLTTIMCQILGYPDNNYYLNALRKFRDEKMQNDIGCLPLLIAYDTIGPIIAENLSIDSKKETISKTLFERYIIPTVTATEEGKDKQAIDIYVAMTSVLANRYQINTNIIIDEKLNDYDIKNLGHGKTLKRTKPETI